MKKSILCCLAALALSLGAVASTGGLFTDAVNRMIGEVVESRNLRNFNQIENRGNLDIYFVQSNRYVVEVVGTSEDIRHITTRVEKGVLHISSRSSGSWFSKKARVRVSCPVLNKFTGRGNGDFFSKKPLRVNGAVTIETIGNGDIEAKAISCNDLTLTTRGNGDIHIGDGVCNGQLQITSQGNGDVYCNVIGQDIRITTRGSGDISYMAKGKSNSISLETFGSGDIDAKVNTQRLVANTRGSGDITIGGYARQVETSHRGSGDVYTSGLRR